MDVPKETYGHGSRHKREHHFSGQYAVSTVAASQVIHLIVPADLPGAHFVWLLSPTENIAGGEGQGRHLLTFPLSVPASELPSGALYRPVVMDTKDDSPIYT